jgi:polyisoprenoid-binding protein YceI
MKNYIELNASKSLAAILPALILIGCSNPADDVAEAQVTSSTNATEAASGAPVGARIYEIQPDTSTIEFVGSKVTGKHDGGFKKFEGQIAVVNGRVPGPGSKVIIDTDSIWSDSERLTGHLKSPDFFNAAAMPTATFVATSITEQPTNSLVTGNLTLHGITKQITFPAQIQVADDEVQVKAEFFINRFDFDMKYPGKADDLIRNEVVLKLKVKAQANRQNVATKT